MVKVKAASSAELWQAYEEHGASITMFGLPIRSAAKGVLHSALHPWICRVKNDQLQVPLQKRAAHSKIWLGYYDTSAVGHLNLNETPLAAALRENKEKVGMEIIPDTVQSHFRHRQELHYELQWVFGFDATGTLHFTLASREIASIFWVHLDGGLTTLIAGKVKRMHILSHDAVCFVTLKRALAWS